MYSILHSLGLVNADDPPLQDELYHPPEYYDPLNASGMVPDIRCAHRGGCMCANHRLVARCTNQPSCRAAQCQPRIQTSRLPRLEVSMYYFEERRTQPMRLLGIKWSAASGEWTLQFAFMADDLDFSNPFLSRTDFVPQRRIYYFATPQQVELCNPGFCRELWGALTWDELAAGCAESRESLRAALDGATAKIKPE